MNIKDDMSDLMYEIHIELDSEIEKVVTSRIENSEFKIILNNHHMENFKVNYQDKIITITIEEEN